MRIVFCAVLALAASFSAMADTVFKCQDSSGKTVFSDKACGAAAEKIEFSHPESYYDKAMRESAESRQRSTERMRELAAERAASDQIAADMRRKHEAICTARKAQDGLFIGMTKDNIFAHEAWGYPDNTTKTTSAQGVKEYLVYECEGYPSVRMFVTNGRLSSIHN